MSGLPGILNVALCAVVIVASPTNLSGATPLHHYALDTLAIFDSNGTAQGELINGASLGSGALNLDGLRNYAEFNSPLIPTSGSFSVALFARELSPTSDRMEMISQGTSYGPGFYIGYYPPSRSIRVGDQWQTTGVQFPDDHLWHHYAVTVDDTATRLYIDGVLRAKTSPIKISDKGTNTRLGQQFDTWGEFFHGSVDELWIFSGALSADEVSLLSRTGTRLAGTK